MLFVRYKFRDIEHNNTTLCTHFSNSSLVHAWHLLMTQQDDAVSNLCDTNCSRAPSVVWNPHFILVHLFVKIVQILFHNWERNKHFVTYTTYNITSHITGVIKLRKWPNNIQNKKTATHTTQILIHWTNSSSNDKQQNRNLKFLRSRAKYTWLSLRFLFSARLTYTRTVWKNWKNIRVPYFMSIHKIYVLQGKYVYNTCVR